MYADCMQANSQLSPMDEHKPRSLRPWIPMMSTRAIAYSLSHHPQALPLHANWMAGMSG